jgi:cell division protein FtsB
MASNNPFQPLLDRIPAPFRNRYFLALVIFVGWLIFFDKHDVLTQWKLQRTVNKLEQDKDYYSKEIKRAEQKRLDLEVNKEKYAREQYYMKKDNEEVFIIEKVD